MQEFRKRWLSLSVVLASSLGSQTVAGETSAPPAEPPGGAAITLAAAGEGEGEGAMGEGEGEGASASVDLKTHDPAYLARLGQIRGHLLAGYRLYKQGHAKMAASHMKHPRDEIYAGLEPALRHRGAAPFGEALSALADAVKNEADRQTVDQAYQQLQRALDAAEAAVEPSLRDTLLGVARLVRSAGEEYAIGVRDSKLANVHEYQDAWGFTQIAQRRLENLDPALRKQAEKTVARAQSRLAGLDDLWPSLVPGERVDGDAARLFGAAARIEISALELGG